MDPTGSPIHFINVEYFFRLIYNILHGSVAVTGTVATPSSGGFDFNSFILFVSHLWLFITVLAFLACLALIAVIIYSTLRIFQIRDLEEPRYATKSEPVVHAALEKSRWSYIQELIESGQSSDWRQAIIESDIMLDELFIRLGYPGETLGERMRAASPSQVKTLSNAWDAHKVRNDIAHQGSAFELSESVAHRTIANYELIFKEFGEI
jgi:hypothetical protein